MFGCTILLPIEKSESMPKTIGNRKGIVREVALVGKHHLKKSADSKALIRKTFVSLPGLISDSDSDSDIFIYTGLQKK